MVLHPDLNITEFRNIRKQIIKIMLDYKNKQLICLSNLENLNVLFINEGLSQQDRLTKLNRIAISQMQLLTEDTTIKKIGGGKQ